MENNDDIINLFDFFFTLSINKNIIHINDSNI